MKRESLAMLQKAEKAVTEIKKKIGKQDLALSCKVESAVTETL